MHLRCKPDSVPIWGPYHLSSPNLTIRIHLPTPRAASSRRIAESIRTRYTWHFSVWGLPCHFNRL